MHKKTNVFFFPLFILRIHFHYRRIFLDAFIGTPNELAMDFNEQILCWTDGGAEMTQRNPKISPKIECVNLDGGNRQPVVEFENDQNKPYGITLTKNHVYWTDWKEK